MRWWKKQKEKPIVVDSTITEFSQCKALQIPSVVEKIEIAQIPGPTGLAPRKPKLLSVPAPPGSKGPEIVIPIPQGVGIRPDGTKDKASMYEYIFSLCKIMLPDLDDQVPRAMMANSGGNSQVLHSLLFSVWSANLQRNGHRISHYFSNDGTWNKKVLD